MFCEKTKEYLSQKNVAFQDRNIAQDPSALEELRKLKVMTTPVTVVDGAVIVGFDIDKLDAALKK
jgi:glutaredoxin